MSNNCDILLIMAPPWGTDMPPLGLAYILSYLKSRGINSHVLDLNIKIYSQMEDERRKELWNAENIRCWVEKDFFSGIFNSLKSRIEHFLNKIFAYNSPVIGFSVNRSNMLFSIELAKLIKEKDKNKIIVFGGPSCWVRNKENIPIECYDVATKKLQLYPGLVDLFIVGEGEETAYDAMVRIKRGEDLMGIPGSVVYSERGSYSSLIPRAPIENLDALPHPTFSEFDINEYGEKKIPFIFSRGCMGRCSFCNDPSLTGKYRCRSARNVFEEIKYHIKDSGVTFFHSCDLLINGNLRLLDEFSDFIISSGYKIIWTGQAVVHPDMSESLLRKMNQAGCKSLVFGIESFSDKVLHLMDKRFTKDEAGLVLRRAHNAGIQTVINIIVGFPGEEEGDFLETIEAVRRMRDAIDCISSLSTCVVTPLSPLDQNAGKFEIQLSPSGDYSRWILQDGSNDYEVRKQRLKKLISYLQEHNIPCLSTNLYDEGFQKINKKDIASSEEAVSSVLLVICPCWGTVMPPLGLASVAAFVRKKTAINVDVLDLNIAIFNRAEEQEKKLWGFNNSSHWTDKESFQRLRGIMSEEIDFCARKVLDHPARMIGFSVYSTNRFFTIEVIKRIREVDRQRIIVVGGRGCVNHDARMVFRLADIDIFVEGEGEGAFYDIVKTIAQRGKAGRIPGAIFCKDGQMLDYIPRPVIEDISALPFPDYRGFPFSEYAERALPLLMSRGCISRCSFCNDYKLMGRYRLRKSQRVLEEVEYHFQANRISNFYFSDAAINGDLEELELLCEGIIREGIDIQWVALAIPRKGMSFELLAKMKNAGCKTLNFGVETGSDRILRLMRKIVTIADIEEVLKNACKAGINTQINFIVGFPGEGEKEFNETLEFIRRNRNWVSGVTNINACNVLLNSDLFERAQDYGILFPPELFRRDTGWYTAEGNNSALRIERTRKVIALLNELDIPIVTSNLQEREANLLRHDR